MPPTRLTRTGCGASTPKTAKPPRRNSARRSPATCANTACNTGSSGPAMARSGGFRSNPPSSVTSMARPPAWSARTAMSPSRWWPTSRFGKARSSIAGLADQLAELNATLAQRVEEKTRERDRIWNVSQDLLLVSDRDGVWRTVNPAWTRTLGWSEAELLNRSSEWLEHPDDGGTTRAQVRKLRRARNHRQVRKPLPPQGRLVPLAVVDRGVRQGLTIMPWPATSPRRRPRPNG